MRGDAWPWRHVGLEGETKQRRWHPSPLYQAPRFDSRKEGSVGATRASRVAFLRNP